MTPSTNYVVEAVPDSADKKLHIVSVYMQKNSGGINQELNMKEKTSPQHTSETKLGTVASATNSIPQTGAKSQGKNSSGELTGEAVKGLIAIEQDHRRKGATEDELISLRTAFQAAYLYGTTGKLQASDRADLRAMGLDNDEINLAFAHGREAIYGNTQQKQTMKEERSNERNEVRIRDGGKRNGGKES